MNHFAKTKFLIEHFVKTINPVLQKCILALCFICWQQSFSQQAPSIQWQNTIGSLTFDDLNCVRQTPDGGYILAGSSNSSIGGDKTLPSLGGYDFWVVKTDVSGNILWQKVIGGTGQDFLVDVELTTDGGYILGGYSGSGISGNKTEANYGDFDYWVVKIDDLGNIQWQNTIGGNMYDYLTSIKQTTDGGYIIGGYSYSGNTGEKTENAIGFSDYWVIKINSSGAIQWQNTIGGTQYDNLNSIEQTSDGGYILGGHSNSDISGDKTENNLGNPSTFDYWIVKIDASGNIQWQNTIGGFNNENLAVIHQTSDGGYVIGGKSLSNVSADKTENSNGDYDYWIVKTDPSGVIQWQNDIGGTLAESFNDIHQTSDGGYILGGISLSNSSGDKAENNIDTTLNTIDCWIVKLYPAGNIKWQNTIGGNSNEYLYSIIQTNDGGYLLGATSWSSISGDKTENSLGNEDYWLVKLFPDAGCVVPSATITPAGPTIVCSGNVVLNANTGTGLTYQWKNNGVNIAGATTASYTTTLSGNYTVVVTATGGCSATSVATVVTVGALAVAITPSGPVTICSGTSTTLSATAGTGYTYQWYRNNVLLSATTQTFTTSTQGTYKCVVTSGSCSATSISVVINVPTTPAASVSYSTPLSFCSPGSVTFTANTLSGAIYQWENNSVTIPGATTQTYVATGAGAYRVKETKSGCTGYSSVKTVTTAASVTAAISTVDPTTQCTGGTVNMNITNPIPGYTYQWKNYTVNIAGATGNSYAATTTGNYTIATTASCGTATSNAIAVIIGTVSAQVTPSGNAVLCTGGSLTLTANTGAGYGYQWKNNNASIAGAISSTYTVTSAGSYTVAITSPCGNATSAATVVTQAGVVTASVAPAGSTVCSGGSITFTANAGTGYAYKWYRNNVLLTATSQTYTTGTAGSYKVEVSIGGSCAVQSNTATLTVINNPTPTITAGGPTTFCVGQSVTFTANSYAGVMQQWQKNSVNIAGATTLTYTANAAGSYRVQQTANGCSKFSSKKTVTVNCRVGDDGVEISSDEADNVVAMEVFPNPFADKLSINITSPVTEQTEITLIDVLGKVQYTQFITTNATIELNTQLPVGIYMIKATIDGTTKVMRVIKTK